MEPDQKPSHMVVDPDAPGPADDEPMTEAQAAELRELTDKLGEEYDESLTKRQADERIAALKEQSGD